MSLAPRVAQWTQLVATHLPPVSQTQATVLAWGSLFCPLAALGLAVVAGMTTCPALATSGARSACFGAA